MCARPADEETTLRYSVVQYVLPAAQLVNISRRQLTIPEDEPGTLRLSDIVSVSSPPASQEQLGEPGTANDTISIEAGVLHT